mmetsp:Transcript_38477/g.83361  ORF Transcript_38477/g.83361 Transcript_38477/m.83361 type:complete len:210 (+) Transcript_38477:108-737(+)
MFSPPNSILFSKRSTPSPERSASWWEEWRGDAEANWGVGTGDRGWGDDASCDRGHDGRYCGDSSDLSGSGRKGSEKASTRACISAAWLSLATRFVSVARGWDHGTQRGFRRRKVAASWIQLTSLASTKSRSHWERVGRTCVGSPPMASTNTRADSSAWAVCSAMSSRGSSPSVRYASCASPFAMPSNARHCRVREAALAGSTLSTPSRT